jgi:hypothetical protein
VHPKKGSRVSISSRDVTNQTPPGQELLSYDVIIPAQGEFGSDIPAGDGKLANLFLRCVVFTLDLVSACSMLRVFHHVSSEMCVAIFKALNCFSFLQASRDFFPSSNTVKMPLYHSLSLSSLCVVPHVSHKNCEGSPTFLELASSPPPTIPGTQL